LLTKSLPEGGWVGIDNEKILIVLIHLTPLIPLSFEGEGEVMEEGRSPSKNPA